MSAALVPAALACVVVLLAQLMRLRRDRARLCEQINMMATGQIASLTQDGGNGSLSAVAAACEQAIAPMQATIAALERAARLDPLTRLLSAPSFRIACQRQLVGCVASPDAPAGVLLVLGLCDLRRVNDNLGRDGGDQLLCAVADRLRLIVGAMSEAGLTQPTALVSADAPNPAPPSPEPIIGRLYGDEFALFVPGLVCEAATERFIRRLLRVIGEAYHVSPQPIRPRLAVGAAFVARPGQPYDDLLAAADTALSAARSEGTDRYRFFTPDMRHAADALLRQEMELRRALAQNQFCLHFQPQLCLKTGDIVAVEALIRWQHPTRGLVYPGEFIPFAENYGLIDEIGDWVILTAIRTAARWAREGHPLRVSLNISPKQFARIELIAMIRACLTRFGLAPGLLEIEITEAAILRSADFALERIAGLRRDGVSVALDDFGTGYSNLSQMMSLPMDRLKFDKSLIDTIVTDPRLQMVVTTMIRMAGDLGFEVVAEGVENPEQFALLRSAGCHHIQGFFLSRALPEEELLPFTERFRNLPGMQVA